MGRGGGADGLNEGQVRHRGLHCPVLRDGADPSGRDRQGFGDCVDYSSSLLISGSTLKERWGGR